MTNRQTAIILLLLLAILALLFWADYTKKARINEDRQPARPQARQSWRDVERLQNDLLGKCDCQPN